jgi:cobalt/nickel transport system permease protein
MVVAAIIAAVVALQFGSLGVVLQTTASGVSSLPFKTFLLLMQPIHLAIGVIEGVVTALVVSFVYRARPDILQNVLQEKPLGDMPMRSLLVTFLAATVLIGGVLSWFASEHPDGLEWSIAKVTGSETSPESGLEASQGLKSLQEKTAILPGYTLPGAEEDDTSDSAASGKARVGTSASGIIGGMITLTICILVGVILRKRTKNPRSRA